MANFADLFLRADTIRAAHEIYMNEFGYIEHPRLFRGLHPGRLRVLQYILEHDDGPTVGRIAKWTRMSDSNASHILAELREKECVVLHVDPADARSRIVELTALGRAAALEWRHHVRAVLCDRIWRWPARKQEAIAETMTELAHRLRSAEYY